MEVLGPILAVVVFCIIMGTCYWFIEDPAPRQKLREKKKQKLIDKGVLKSDAYIQGYRDMGMALSEYAHLHYCGDNSVPKFHASHLEKMVKNYNGNFDPKKGRTSKQYLAADSSKVFEDYYAGGMQLLDEVDSAQARLLDEKLIIQKRMNGLEQFDRQTMEAKKELDKLRNKAYNSLEEHEEFDKMIKTPRKKIGWPSISV